VAGTAYTHECEDNPSNKFTLTIAWQFDYVEETGQYYEYYIARMKSKKRLFGELAIMLSYIDDELAERLKQDEPEAISIMMHLAETEYKEFVRKSWWRALSIWIKKKLPLDENYRFDGNVVKRWIKKKLGLK